MYPRGDDPKKNEFEGPDVGRMLVALLTGVVAGFLYSFSYSNFAAGLSTMRS